MHSVSAEGKPLPSELRRDEAKLRHDVELEDDNTAVPRTHIDDEYAHAGERDPKILITTSRDPSTRLVSFAKELKLVFPNAQRINRGGMVNYLHPPFSSLSCATATSWSQAMLVAEMHALALPLCSLTPLACSQLACVHLACSALDLVQQHDCVKALL